MSAIKLASFLECEAVDDEEEAIKKENSQEKILSPKGASKL